MRTNLTKRLGRAAAAVAIGAVALIAAGTSAEARPGYYWQDGGWHSSRYNGWHSDWRYRSHYWAPRYYRYSPPAYVYAGPRYRYYGP